MLRDLLRTVDTSGDGRIQYEGMSTWYLSMMRNMHTHAISYFNLGLYVLSHLI